jgi:hypothetical protein
VKWPNREQFRKIARAIGLAMIATTVVRIIKAERKK